MHQSVTNIFEYSNILDPNIYSDIRSYQNFDTNIFGYSFMSKISYEFIQISVRVIFLTKYIRIFVRVKIDTNVTLWFKLGRLVLVLPSSQA